MASSISNSYLAPPHDGTNAFARRGDGPKLTFPLALVAITVAVVSMSADGVHRYSHSAFMVGVGLTLVLSVVVARAVDALKGEPGPRLAAALLLPAACGAFIGMVVQAVVLIDVGPEWAVKDLGGTVDTTEPTAWVMSGVVLGGLPALLVSAFLLLAARALRRLHGHDASEGFGVVFTGAAGMLAAFGLLVVDDFGRPPLLLVAMLAAITLVVVLLKGAARVRFLRRVYSGADGEFEIVSPDPRARLGGDPSLVPMVSNADSAAVLVRVHRTIGSYRSAAAEAVALVGVDEEDTLRPLLRRRIAASAMLASTVVLVALSVFSHGSI
jgi:hypothetical protein